MTDHPTMMRSGWFAAEARGHWFEQGSDVARCGTDFRTESTRPAGQFRPTCKTCQRLLARDLERSSAPVLHVESAYKALNSGTLERVRRILRAHRGRARVFLHAVGSDGKPDLFELRRVRVSTNKELLDQLDALPDVRSAYGPDPVTYSEGSDD